MKKLLTLSILGILAMLFSFANVSPATAQAGTIFYVKQAATGTGDGLSWANATTLQDALGSATSGAEIWVAKGLYKPASGTDLTVSFNLVPGVAVYGGFDPDNGDDTFAERDWVANPTVLSGDLGGDDITDANGVVANWTDIQNTASYNNSYHVVVADGTTGTPITGSTVLDGFIITAGYAGGGYGGMDRDIYVGGGFYCNGAGSGNECSPSLNDVTFSGIQAVYDGGAMYNDGRGGGNSSPILTNVTFTGSRSEYGTGGAMYNNGFDGGNSSPSLTDVTFEGNSAGIGGAMYNNGSIYLIGVGDGTSNGSSSPILNNVTFSNNSASNQGGAMYNDGVSESGIGSGGGSSPTLINVTFSNNSAFNGGAIYNAAYNSGDSSPSLTDVTFDGNSATSYGGAIYNDGSYQGNSSPIVTDVTFSNNSASTGGAMYNIGACSGDSSPILNRVTFSNNSATAYGGAMYSEAQSGDCASPGYSNPILTNVAFSGNSATLDGGAIYYNFACTTCAIPASLTNVSFSLNSANQGGAIYNNAPPSKLNDIDYRNSLVLTNVILWGDSTTGEGAEIYNNGADLTISHSVLEGGIGAIANIQTGTIADGGNNLTTDPLFINAGSGDLQLPSGSPAIDAGDDTVCPATDLLGAIRPYGTHCDSGAYEYGPPLRTVTFNANGGSGAMAPQTNNIPANLTSNSLTRTGYNFFGWNTATDGTGTAYADGAVYDFSADLTLFAQWSDPDDFIIKVKTDNLLSGSSTNTQFAIPTTGSGYNYNVDCNNDGTDEVTGYTSSTGYICEYGPAGLNTGAGTYTIRIKDNSGFGTGFPRIYFNYGKERLKLLDVQQWGTGKWSSMNGAFSGCNNLATFTATDTPDLSIVTNMSFMFTATWGFSADMSNWDTSHVTNMAYMFNDASDFNGDISGWNTGNVTSMVGMFKYAPLFNQDISGWDTTKVTNMGEMFVDADAFNQDISGWNTGNVTNMNYMFQNTSIFDQNLGAWNVAKVTSAISMFAGKALSIPNYDALLIGWDAQTLKPNVTFSGGYSRYCTAVAAHDNMTNVDGWNITDNGQVSCFTVTFDANGGSGTMNPQIDSSWASLASNTFTRTGYTFTGWNTAANGSGTNYADNGVYDFSADGTLYAQWSVTPHTVTFDANSGSGTMTPQTNSGAANLTTNSFSRTHYTFTGWNTAANGTGTAYADGASYDFSADIVLFAQWAINSYSVTFNANGGNGTMSNQSYNYNVTANLTANSFTRTGYTFTGWNTAADGSGTSYVNSASYTFTANVTLYAQWSIITYTVTFNANGGSGTMAPQTSNYNVPANLTANAFTLAGYTFTGWNTAANGSGTGYADEALYPFTASATLYAQWSDCPTTPILYVDQSAAGGATGNDWTNAQSDLAAALTKAALCNAAEVWVAAGTYKPGTARTDSFNLVPGVALYGGFDPANGIDEFIERDWETYPIILSGDIGTPNDNSDNSYHVVVADGTTGTPIDVTTIVDGFTITAGRANGGSFPDNSGGGFFCNGSWGSGNDCSPTVRNVIFSGNSATNLGGAMFNYGPTGGKSSPSLTNVTFSDNSAGGKGGAMANYGISNDAGVTPGDSSPTLTDVTFSNNSAQQGGAMYNDGNNGGKSSPILTNVQFLGNSSSWQGGAMANDGGGGGISNPILTDVIFTGNRSGGGQPFGGGMFNWDSNVTLTNVVFSGNVASGLYPNGGGMWSFRGSQTLTNVVFSGNTVIASNTNAPYYGNGGGMFISGNNVTRLTNVTFSDNSATYGGGAIFGDYGDVTISNSIIANNTPANCGVYTGGNIVFQIDHSLVDAASCGVVDGVDGNVVGNPLFVRNPDPGDGDWATPNDNDYGDLRLQPGSPAIDTGTNTGCPATDLLGVARPVGALCDMGAYEGAVATAVAPTVTITTSELTRSNEMPSCTYSLYHSSSSYSGFSVLVADMVTTTYDISGDIGGVPDYYYVEVDCGVGGTAVSSTVGEFSFVIVPGS